MGFHEVQFPTAISRGFKGGPGFNTAIIVTDSGTEHRVQRWETARRKYTCDVDLGQSDAYAVLQFFIDRSGAANGFRFKDWTDFCTTATGTNVYSGDAAVTDEDASIGTGDGSETTFQLVKTYTSGSTSRNRTIEKPVSGTVVVAFDGVAQASGWSVSTTTGIVTFTSAPTTGVEITAGFEFDVPVRFGSGTDAEGLQLVVGGYDEVRATDIELVELRYTGEHYEEFDPGGAKSHGTITADTAITVGEGKIHRFEPATTGLAVVLPDADTLPGGGPYFLIDNQGSETLTVENTAGTSAISVTAGNQAELWVSLDSGGNREWVAFG